MATHSSILIWEIPWTEEPGGLQSMGLQRVRHHLMTKQQHVYICVCVCVYYAYIHMLYIHTHIIYTHTHIHTTSITFCLSLSCGWTLVLFLPFGC